MTFIFDGVQWLRADQIDVIQESVTEKGTDRYAVEPRKVPEFTRHVTLRSGGRYSSPGEATELVTIVTNELVADFFDGVPPVGPGGE